MSREFTSYTSLSAALDLLRQNAKATPRRESVALGLSFGRVLYGDVLSRQDIPERDSAHMDGFAVRSSDTSHATPASPVGLRVVRGSGLGVLSRRELRRGDAYSVLTGGFVPPGADSVVQAEKVKVNAGMVSFSNPVEKGEFIYPRGRDVKRGEKVLAAGRVLRGTDLVLLGSLHMDRVRVHARPRVAIVPTGNELSENVRDTEPGKVAETHSLLLAKLVEGAGGLAIQMPIARDDSDEIRRSIRAGLKVADVVLTIAGSSVSDTDFTEDAINRAGAPGVMVHGMRVHRGRVMGFGVARGKAVVILPGPIQGAVNAFALMAYPLIRAFLGRGFEPPPAIPAIMGNDWDAGRRYRDFTKVVYVRIGAEGGTVTVNASVGETEKVTFLTQSDGYLLVGENTTTLNKGDPVRVHLLPGLSPFS